MPIRWCGLVCIWCAAVLPAAGQDATQLYKEGRKAEQGGDVVRAYLFYSEAAALNPKRADYWRKSLALRTRAALKGRALPKPSLLDELPVEEEAAATTLSPDDLAEVRRLRPPPELKAKPGRQTLHLRGDAKSVFEQALRAYNLDVVFDGDYQGGPALYVPIQDADYREAIHTVEAATSSFAVPLAERLLLVAKDTPQKRADVEPTVAVTIPIPDPVTVQEAQEMARAIQQTMEIIKFAVDGTRRMVLIKDRLSKVLPAQALFEQLAWRKPEVEVEIDFLEVDKSAAYTYGLQLPSNFPLVWAGNSAVAATTQSLARFLFGNTLIGVGIANAQLFANMTRSSSQQLLQAFVRSLDGSTATFHVGDKYPIVTGGFLGTVAGIPPAFTFEDLGLTLKIVPHVHGEEEVSLDLSAEFKVLGGQSLNGIPVISNRKFDSKVRLRQGEWALVAGLMDNNEARTISGLAGLSSVPWLGALLRRNDTSKDSTQVLILLKPRLLSAPPGEYLTRELYVGSEGRLQIPL